LTVVLNRVLADRRQSEDDQAAPAAREGDAGDPVAPDLGERRLGWLVAAAAIAVVVVLAATLSRLPGLRGSPDPSALQGAPAVSGAGDAPAAGDATPGPAGSTSTGTLEAPLLEGGPGDPAAAPGARGGPLTPAAAGSAAGVPGPGATAAPGGTAAAKTTAPAATGGPEATAEPVPTTDLPPDVQAALAELSAAIRQQVAAGQFDRYAGDDLQGKVHQVAREVSEGDWAAARYYAGRIRDKLGKYRDDRRLTSTGYQVLVARVDALNDALS
jgi:hypothetical protein